MKDQFIDGILLTAMILGVYLVDYRPHKKQRNSKVNVCYMILLVLSATIMVTSALMPNIPVMMELFSQWFQHS